MNFLIHSQGVAVDCSLSVLQHKVLEFKNEHSNVCLEGNYLESVTLDNQNVCV